MINQALYILQTVFGYKDFRLLQKNIIENVLNRKDTLVIMPTGSGKSICYQIPALLFEGLTIVISPLISLMKDQVEQLEALDIPAAFLNSTLTYQEYNKTLHDIRTNKLKLLYLAPETLLKPQIMDLIQTIKIDCLTIDEAHCISEWGHDFRPEYRQLVRVRKQLPQAVCIALTATATPLVQEDIKKSLGFQASNRFLSSFDRDNLMIEIVLKQDPVTQTLDFIKKFPGQPGIIYCFSKKQVDTTTKMLTDAGYLARPYHAGLADEERKKNQDLFIKDDIQIIVATVAFGMGINKPNVRFVLHYDLPKNIESYYQQIGRAGRDGLQSYCLLLFSYGDINKINFIISEKSPDEQVVALGHLNELIKLLESQECRRIGLLHYFGETYSKENCGMCDNCLEDNNEDTDLTIPAQKFLSCVKRTGEKFGASHIINVLRGSNARKIIDFHHHTISTYGIGKEFSTKQWQYISHQLLRKKMVVQDIQYGGLTLTGRAYKVFRGEEKVYGTVPVKENKSSASQTAKPAAVNNCERPDLLEILKIKRKELADELRVPPYVIFSDKTLLEMAAILPVKPGELLQIYGIGQAKLDKFGDIFLEIIKTYCREQGIEKNEPEKTPAEPVLSAKDSKGPKKYEKTVRLFTEGVSIESIAAESNIKVTTVMRHLYDFLKEGKSLPEENLKNHITIEQEQILEIEKSFGKHGTQFLRPVFEDMDGNVDYDTIHVLRLLFLSKMNRQKISD